MQKGSIRRPGSRGAGPTGMRITASRLALVASLGAVAVAPSTAAAGQANWISTVSNDWFTAGNWDTNAVPGSSDTAIIDTSTVPAWIFSGMGTASSVWVGNNNSGSLQVLDFGTLDIGGSLDIGSNAGSTGSVQVSQAGSWIHAADINVGIDGQGEMDVSSGASVTSGDSQIGSFVDGNGRVTVTGALWTVNGIVSVGVAGTGVLDIESGGEVSVSGLTEIGVSPGGTGKVQVTGAGAQFETDKLTIGEDGSGQFYVLSGAQAQTGETIIGSADGSQGYADIADNGATWSVASGDDVTVGDAGTGKLEVTGGALDFGYNLLLGNSASGTGTVTLDGSDSSLKVDHVITVGVLGSGEFDMANGAQAQTEAIIFGGQVGSTGTGTITGKGTVLALSASLTVGSNGSGTFGILQGGAVSTDLLYVGIGATANGALTIDGKNSSLEASGGASIGYDGVGSLTISNGGLASVVDGVALGYDASGIGTLTVTGTDSFINAGSELSVGRQGHGILTIANGGALDAKTLYLG